MCYFGSDDSGKKAAAEARRAEEQRQAAIRAGLESVDSAFSGFDDSYYDTLRNAHTGYYNPQLEEQRSGALKDLILSASQQGKLASSSFAKDRNKLSDAYGKAQTQIASEADSTVNSRMSEVENARSNLYSQVRAGAGQGDAAGMAAAQAKMLMAPPTFSPLANAFGDVLSNLSSGVDVANKKRYYDIRYDIPSINGTDSSKVVSG